MSLGHFFLPHPDTHKKAWLISTPALLIYLIFFLILQSSFLIIPRAKPGILGIAADLKVVDLISLTNKEREKNGLFALKEDSRLDDAAAAKAKNMFEENYWAHYSPSGKDPWGFIQAAGYKFSYAGENLARNFYNSPEVVGAWMASETHRENIVNPHYINIGMAVMEGTLNGQPTVLVVQEFGTPQEYLALASPFKQKEKINEESQKSLVASVNSSTEAFGTPIPSVMVVGEKRIQPVVASEKLSKNWYRDPYLITKNLGMGLFLILSIIILLDLYIIRRRAVHRLGFRHWPHLAMIAVGASTLFNLLKVGNVL